MFFSFLDICVLTLDVHAITMYLDMKTVALLINVSFILFHFCRRMGKPWIITTILMHRFAQKLHFLFYSCTRLCAVMS
jgi:hypothetical protein